MSRKILPRTSSVGTETTTGGSDPSGRRLMARTVRATAPRSSCARRRRLVLRRRSALFGVVRDEDVALPRIPPEPGAPLTAGQHGGCTTRRQLESSGAMWEPIVGCSRGRTSGAVDVGVRPYRAVDGAGTLGGEDAAEGADKRDTGLGRPRTGRRRAAGRRPYRMLVNAISRWREVGPAHGEVLVEVEVTTPCPTG